MRRAFALGVLVMGSVHGAAAQEVSPGRILLRAGAGLSSADYTCTGCTIDAETGFTALVAGTHALGRVLTVGLETTLSRATGDAADVTLVGALATAGARRATRLPVWGSVGLGWVWYSGIGPNSEGPALSARAGVDIPVGSSLAVSPYAGYLTMLGHDGPRTVVGPTSTPTDPGVATRVASLQFGLALTVTP
jgi:hypothetical protein